MLKKIKVFLACLLAMLLIFVPFSVMVSAHGFSPPRYPSIVYCHPTMNIGVARLDYYISTFSSSNYRTQLNYAINDWEMQDSGHVHMNPVSESQANIIFYDTWDSKEFGPFAYGVTLLWGINGYANRYGINWTEPVYLEDCVIYTRNEVYINKASQADAGFNNYDIRKTWAHEIGHCLGFDEANDGTRSIMRQGKGSTLGWSNYWLPQDHDRSDLATKFKWTTVFSL